MIILTVLLTNSVIFSYGQNQGISSGDWFLDQNGIIFSDGTIQEGDQLSNFHQKITYDYSENENYSIKVTFNKVNGQHLNTQLYKKDFSSNITWIRSLQTMEENFYIYQTNIKSENFPLDNNILLTTDLNYYELYEFVEIKTVLINNTNIFIKEYEVFYETGYATGNYTITDLNSNYNKTLVFNGTGEYQIEVYNLTDYNLTAYNNELISIKKVQYSPGLNFITEINTGEIFSFDNVMDNLINSLPGETDPISYSIVESYAVNYHLWFPDSSINNSDFNISNIIEATIEPNVGMNYGNYTIITIAFIVYLVNKQKKYVNSNKLS
ncbi:MAG: hypothetical protein OEY49_14880 [Candidatus Heimdallarchaeota archaeon]|nr:hypothetical protein [Candidatus Heimdallarchaeota archaeon]